MPERQTAQGDSALLRGIVADQAKGNARFDEIFRRLRDVEVTSSEARDTGKEILTVLREQNALAKIEEVRAETSRTVDALRQDTVHAIELVRKHVEAKAVELGGQIEEACEQSGKLAARVGALESLRDQGTGMAKAGRLAAEAAKLLIAAGAGGLVIKVIGG